MLHIEGYKEKGCTNAYVNSTTHLISEDKFNIDIKINASWQIIFLPAAPTWRLMDYGIGIPIKMDVEPSCHLPNEAQDTPFI